MSVIKHVDFEVPDWGELQAGPTEVPASSDVMTYPEKVLSLSPLGYWRLGDSGATAVDETGSADGLITDSVTTGLSGALVGDSDSAMGFDGLTGWVETQQAVIPLVASGALTLGGWVRTAQANSVLLSQYVFSSHPDGAKRFGLRTTAAGKLSWWKGGSTLAESGSVITDNTWHFFVATRSAAGAISLYVDGVLDGSGTDLLGFTNSPLGIAAFPAVVMLNGEMDEVFVVDSEVSAADLLEIYQIATGAA